MKSQNLKRIFSYFLFLIFLIVIIQFKTHILSSNANSTVHHNLTTDEVMIVIKTSWKNYETRLNSIISTWYQLAPSQVQENKKSNCKIQLLLFFSPDICCF